MSVSTKPNTDTSTENANWGTLVVLLVLAFTAVTIGVILYNDSQKPAVPITLTAPASASPVSTPPASSPGDTGAAASSSTGGTSGGQ